MPLKLRGVGSEPDLADGPSLSAPAPEFSRSTLPLHCFCIRSLFLSLVCDVI